MNDNQKNKSSENLVSFLLVGAQKSGTTTLHSYLSEHPQIQMAKKKEVHFFNTESYFINQKPDYDYYHSWFDFENNKNLQGESTPAYLYCRDSAKRIWQYNPMMKIIIILRNPIERAFSHWNMEVHRGADQLGFREALLKESERTREVLPSQHYVYSYVDRGYYTSQIREYWRFFGKNQVLVLKYDCLKNDIASVLKKLYGFLGVDVVPAGDIASQKKVLHKAKYITSMDIYSKTHLIKCFENEILQLEEILGWDCRSWLDL